MAGPHGARGGKPPVKVKNPMKLLKRVMGYVLKNYKVVGWEKK